MAEIMEPIQLRKKTTDEKQEAERQNKEDHNFYHIVKQNNTDYKDISLYRINYLFKLKKFGFFRYDMDNGNSAFIHIENNRIQQINETQITDKFIRFIEDLQPYQHEWVDESGEPKGKLITSEIILEKMLKSLDTYFSKSLLNRLLPDQPIVIKGDTRDSKFLFYRNGFIEVTRHGIDFQEYNFLQEFIWKDQILNRDYRPGDDQKGFFEKFIMNICGGNQERYKSMQTIIGYNLHNFTRCKLFATVLTDARLSQDGEANGRTGKTLWGKGLGHMLNTDEKGGVYVEINGRDFDAKENVKYSACSLSTSLVHINDARNKFNIENLFNDITEGIKVKKLFQDPFIIRPKLIISSNQTIIIEGESARDRVVQFEFSDYYSSEKNPAMEFGHWFFDDWDSDEWNRYDAFMIGCVQQYLLHGLIYAGEINLNIRILQDHTAREFINFMEDILHGGINDESDTLFKVYKDEKYEKVQLFTTFTRLNSDFNNPKFRQRTFTKWVKMYCKKMDVPMEEERTNGKDYFVFK